MQACHCKAQHIYKYLPKRPYLVRQQYASGSSSGGTTSPISFPSDQLSSERKEGGGGGGGGGEQPSFQESKSQSLGIGLPLRMLWIRFFLLSVYSVLCIKDLSRLSLISC